VVRIEQSAFADCSKLARVNFGKGLDSIGMNAFANTSLTSVVLPNGITDIFMDAFANIFSLGSISIPGSVHQTGLKAGGRGESGLRGSPNVTIRGLTGSAAEWFAKEYNLPFESTGSATSTWQTNHSNDARNNMKGFIIEDGILYHFATDRPVKHLLIPEGVTRIAPNALNHSRNSYEIERVTIPKGVISIGDRAFSGLYGLLEVHIPEGVLYIGDGAFSDCQELAELIIPKGVVRLGEGSLPGGNLRNLYIPESAVDLGYSLVSFGLGRSTSVYGIAGSAIERHLQNSGVNFVCKSVGDYPAPKPISIAATDVTASSSAAAPATPDTTQAATSPGGTNADSTPPTKLVIDSYDVRRGDEVLAAPAVAPMIINGRTMLPFRYLVQTVLGGEVDYISETRTIIARVGNHNIIMVVDQLQIIIDGNVHEYGVAPVIVEGSTLVPLRAFDQVVKSISWDGDTQTVTIEP